VNARLKQILSWWFILQIVLPFTAPLQTLDLHDLFGAKSHRAAQKLPESTTTPTIGESGTAVSIAAINAPAPLSAANGAVVIVALPSCGPIAPAHVLVSSPQVQQAVLRL
jgi:hypothetical protein